MNNNLVSRKWIVLSIIDAFFIIFASVLGIFNPKSYSQETANWAMQAVGQDIGNLLAVPIFSICLYFLSKKSIKAFFVWLGVLLYFIYAYLIYAFFIHFNYLFLLYVAILGISTYTLIGGLFEQNLPNIVKSLINKKFRYVSILLITIGVLFGLLWLSEVMPALLSGQVPKSTIDAGLVVNPVHVIDLALVLPAMIFTGGLLWKKRLLGYLFAAPWLMFSVLMGSSIIATMIMELNKGNTEATVPFIMVSLIVLASLGALYKYLKNVHTMKF